MPKLTWRNNIQTTSLQPCNFSAMQILNQVWLHHAGSSGHKCLACSLVVKASMCRQGLHQFRLAALAYAEVKATTRKAWQEEQKKKWPDAELLADARRLYQMKDDVARSKHLKIYGLTRGCHQCFNQCVYEPCVCTKRSGCDHQGADEGAQCMRVVCRRCLTSQYGDRNLVDTRGGIMCPPCQGICNCHTHLRKKVERALPLRLSVCAVPPTLRHAASFVPAL
jgi:Zinc-finger domain of monoamine-oxidase A repressor R1